MALHLTQTENTRTYTDEFSGREFSEHRCMGCGSWEPSDETVWSDGESYCCDCAPTDDNEEGEE